MDKELLRVVIIALGATVMVCMILWSVFKNRKPKDRINFYDRKDPLGRIDESLVINTEHDDFDVIPLSNFRETDDVDDPIYNSAKGSLKQESDVYNPEEESDDQQHKSSDFYDSTDDDELQHSDFYDSIEDDEEQPKDEVEDAMAEVLEIEGIDADKTADVPNIIQIHILALEYEGFNGVDLLRVFKKHGFEYGSLKVFESLDEERRVDFTIASMVEPGTFPDTNMELFNCPGIVFFFQPSVLNNPVKVFDHFIETISEIAVELEGVELDHTREQLSKETILNIRRGLLR
jgi:cell division protein ZipA